jgi:hypothetical protein
VTPAPGESPWETTTAFRELLDGLGAVDQTFLDGPKAVGDEQSVAEGYRFLLTALGVALDIYLFAEADRPEFVDINTPTRRDRRWGGDNTDAYYAFAPIDPTRTYRVTGQRGDSDYFSLTVYNEPSPGEWSDRIVGIVNDTDLDIGDDGTFSLVLGPRRPDGHTGAFIELTDDAGAAVTRDYQIDASTGRRVTWHIESLDPPDPIRHTDVDTAERLRTALRWVQTMFGIVPLTVAPRADHTTLGHNSPDGANQFAEPYQVLDANYGWSARDACYSFGSFVLEPDEALVVTHRPPASRFWSLSVWNQFMAGHNAGDDRISVNHGTAVPNADGTVTVVIARRRLDHPNAISTVDHAQGVLAFRWFLADRVPDRPTVELVAAADAPTAVG